MAAVLERTRHKQGWLGAELDRASLYWDFTPAHLRAIDELMEKLKGSGLAFHQIEKRHFSHPALDADLATVLRRIKSGPGLLIMRGFPVDKYSAEEMQSVYWGDRRPFRARLLAKRRRRLSGACHQRREAVARLHDGPRA